VQSLTAAYDGRHVRAHKTAIRAIASATMATYLRVSDDIAERVASGALTMGDELPSMREAARWYGTTTTTVARAYRRLADAGVIDSMDRRRSRVARGGGLAARRLTGQAASGLLRLAGSDDPALDIVLREAGDGRVATVGARGSFHGLTGLWRGTADAAAIHLRHRSGAHNSPFARTLLRGRRPALIHLWRRGPTLRWLIPRSRQRSVTRITASNAGPEPSSRGRHSRVADSRLPPVEGNGALRRVGWPGLLTATPEAAPHERPDGPVGRVRVRWPARRAAG
jgi:DNA-binding transcriptional regulator YhcF (GntR family)